MADQPHVKHAFKKRHFARPTRCYYCSQLIWGVGKNGFRCKECGYNVHLNECVAKAANRTSCTPGKEYPAPFKPIVGARLTKVKGMIQRRSTSDVSAYTQQRQQQPQQLAAGAGAAPQQGSAQDARRVSTPNVLAQGQAQPPSPYHQQQQHHHHHHHHQQQQQQQQAPISFSQAPAMFTAPTIQKLPSQDGVHRHQDMAAAIAEQQRYIASLQQQIAAHQALLYQRSSPAQHRRAPLARPLYEASYAPAPGYTVQQPVVVYGLQKIAEEEAEAPAQQQPPAYGEPAQPSAASQPTPAATPQAVPAASPRAEDGAGAAEKPSPLPAETKPARAPAVPSARAAARAPLQGSSASLPAPEQAAELRKLRVDLDAETIRAQRTSSTSAPAASDLEKALRDLAEAPGSAAPLPEFGDVALPGMETIDFSCGGGLDVLKQISQQYEAQKQQAEAQLSALQQQAGGAPPQQAVVQPAAIAAPRSAQRKAKKELTVDEQVARANEVEEWLAKEIAFQYPNENRIGKLLSALKKHLKPIAGLKEERADVLSLIKKTRDHDMRAGEILTVPPLDDTDWLYDGASDSESDEDFYFVEDGPSDMALDPL